jgi:hypothetical protein
MIKAQTVPVFNYTHPSLSEIKKLAGNYDEKGHAFFVYLQETINMKLADTTWRVSDAQQLGIDSMFKYISPNPEEIPLKDGTWLNSGYNLSEKKMKPSIGKDWTGFCWMFKIGNYSFPIMKEDCANIIRGIAFYAPKYSPLDISAFKRRLDEITNNFNFLSLKVEKNTKDMAELKAEIASLKEGQKTEIEQLKNYVLMTDKKSERRDYLLKGGLDLALAAISGTTSGLLWHIALEKRLVEDDIIREVEGDYTYWQYTLEKQDYTPPQPSGGKSSKFKGSSTSVLASSSANTPKPMINFTGGVKYCGGDDHGDNHGNDHGGCQDNNDVTNIYNTINNILNMITNNQVTNNFFEYVTNNINVLQDFVNNYYTTNNYYEYVTKIEYILNTYNTYVYNTYNTYVTNNTYVVATYSLKGEMKTGKVKIAVLDRGMVKKDNPNKGWWMAGAIALDGLTGFFIGTALHNFQEAHAIKISLKTDLRQMYSSSETSWNSQLSIVKTFGGKKKK